MFRLTFVSKQNGKDKSRYRAGVGRLYQRLSRVRCCQSVCKALGIITVDRHELKELSKRASVTIGMNTLLFR